jgi:hypothetical protein
MKTNSELQAERNAEGKVLGREHEQLRNLSEGKLAAQNTEWLKAGREDRRVNISGTEAHGHAVASEARKIIAAIRPVTK